MFYMCGKCLNCQVHVSFCDVDRAVIAHFAIIANDYSGVFSLAEQVLNLIFYKHYVVTAVSSLMRFS